MERLQPTALLETLSIEFYGPAAAANTSVFIHCGQPQLCQGQQQHSSMRTQQRTPPPPGPCATM